MRDGKKVNKNAAMLSYQNLAVSIYIKNSPDCFKSYIAQFLKS